MSFWVGLMSWPWFRHHDSNPWDRAPPWAIELWKLGSLNRQLLENLMSLGDDIKTEVARSTALAQQVSDKLTALGTQIGQLETAAGVTAADVAAATEAVTELRAANDAMTASLAAAPNPAPAPAPAV